MTIVGEYFDKWDHDFRDSVKEELRDRFKLSFEDIEWPEPDIVLKLDKDYQS